MSGKREHWKRERGGKGVNGGKEGNKSSSSSPQLRRRRKRRATTRKINRGGVLEVDEKGVEYTTGNGIGLHLINRRGEN